MRAPRQQGSLAALAVPNFRYYFTGQVVSTVGTWMQMLAQAWLVLRLTESGAALGITMALQTGPLLVLGAWAGVIADRVDNRKLLMTTAALAGAQALGLGLLAGSGRITVHWIWLFSFFLGIITAFDRPATQAVLYELAGPEELSSAVGLASVINSAGRLIGPAIAGLVIAAVGPSTCFIINGVSYAAVVFALSRVHHAKLHSRRSEHEASARLIDGLRHIRRVPALRHGLLAMTIVGTFAFNFATLVPSMVHFVFEAGPGSLGLVQSVSGLGSVLGGLAVASIRKPTQRTVGVAAVVFGLLIGAAAASPSLFVFMAVWLPLGAAASAFATTDQMMLQHNTEPAYQGRVMSLFSIAWMGTTPVGALLTGAIIQAHSARVAMGLGALATLGCGLLTLVFVRGARRATAAAGQAAAGGVRANSQVGEGAFPATNVT